MLFDNLLVGSTLPPNILALLTEPTIMSNMPESVAAAITTLNTTSLNTNTDDEAFRSGYYINFNDLSWANVDLNRANVRPYHSLPLASPSCLTASPSLPLFIPAFRAFCVLSSL